MQKAIATSDTVSMHNFPMSPVTRLQVQREHLSAARTALRTATEVIHRRMHRHPGLARLAAGTIGRAEYSRLLARSYGFYAMAEPLIGLPGKGSDCLARDLAELGVSAADIAGLPRCVRLDIGNGHAALTGARYVLFGASLGGKVMAKAMAGRPGDEAALPVRFLTSLGENDWKAFATGLEAALPDASSRIQAVAAATATFAAYEQWMEWHE